MNKHFILAAVMLLSLLTSCGSSKSGKDVNDKTTKQVTALIDSLISAEPDMTVASLSVIKAPMPSVMADEVQPALNQSAEIVATFILAQALVGKSSSEYSNIIDSFVAMGAPLREVMKKYESENHPDYVFGLVKLENAKDSTMKERRVYIFDENDLNSVKRAERITNKKNNDLMLLLALAYGDQIDYSNENLKPEDVKAVYENPILKFIVDE